MRQSLQYSSDYAASELIGGILIVLIALVVSAVIYTQLLPVPIPNSEPNVHLVGYVADDGSVVIEHMGGETLMSYEVHVTQNNDTFVYDFENTPWEIGERYSPPVDMELFTEEGEIAISVYIIFNNNEREIIFDGVLNDAVRVVVPSSSSSPVLFSSLRSNSPDEDLFCFGEDIAPLFSPSRVIFNWMINDGGSFSPLANVLFSFDIDDGVVTDYAGGHNGSVYNAMWNASGRCVGAFEFFGDDYISFPYCFDGDFLDDFTIEVWIKTDVSSGTIISFDRDNYCELAVSDSVIKWSTNSSDGVTDTEGSVIVDDGLWHQIVVMYDAEFGKSFIYVDGEIDTVESTHAIGEVLGSGNRVDGLIGRGSGSADRETIFWTGFETQGEKDSWSVHNGSEGEVEETEILFSDSFEGSSWGNWIDGGYDCSLYSGGTYSYDGSYSIHLRDDNGWASSSYTEAIPADSNGYTQMILDFWWVSVSMENGEQFHVKLYDGSNSYVLKTITIGTGGYSNNNFYHTICYVNETDFVFNDELRFVFECDANSDYDHVLFDLVYVNVTGSDRIDCDLDLRSNSIMQPYSGSYCLGGTGDFDPEYAQFNRTGISLAGYSDIQMSIWYSYLDTEDTDYLGLFYLDENNWTLLFEIETPDIGSGQSPWTQVDFLIPEHLDMLTLQFKWMTSSTNEFVAIDDLLITGIPLSGENNFTGLIDELTIYNRVLSSEQVHQNFVNMLNSQYNLSVIVAEELSLGELWKCELIPTTSILDDTPIESNTINIVAYPGGDS